MSFEAGLLLLRMMPSKFMHVVARVSISFLFKPEDCPHYPHLPGGDTAATDTEGSGARLTAADLTHHSAPRLPPSASGGPHVPWLCSPLTAPGAQVACTLDPDSTRSTRWTPEARVDGWDFRGLGVEVGRARLGSPRGQATPDSCSIQCAQ